MKLAEARETHRLTGKALALKSGVSAATVSKIERGRVVPTTKTAKIIAGALGVNVEENVSMRKGGLQTYKICVRVTLTGKGHIVLVDSASTFSPKLCKPVCVESVFF